MTLEQTHISVTGGECQPLLRVDDMTSELASIADALVSFEGPFESNSDRAYRLLLGQIITLRLPPATVLREVELQDRLQVGRTPLHEALQKLASDGLVTIHPRRVTYVTDINVSDLGSIYEIRLPLETLAAGLAAQRRNRSDQALLRQARSQLASAASGTSYGQVMALDRQLHSLVYRIAKNEFLRQTLERFLALCIRLDIAAARRSPTTELRRLVDSVSHLDTLLRAVDAGSVDEAVAAVRQHILETENSLRQAI